MSLIQCHFDYACAFIRYTGLFKVLKNKLQVTQNKIIQFVLNMDLMAHVGSDVFKSLGWLPVSKRVDQIILNHVLKVKSGQSPDYMVEHFIPANFIHSDGTKFRETGRFSIPKVERFGKKSFGYNGCVLWNELPGDIRSLQRYRNFEAAVTFSFLCYPWYWLANHRTLQFVYFKCILYVYIENHFVLFYLIANL